MLSLGQKHMLSSPDMHQVEMGFMWQCGHSSFFLYFLFMFFKRSPKGTLFDSQRGKNKVNQVH